MYISVLNFENKSVDIITIDSEITDPLLIEDILKFRGYDPEKVQYMVTSEISTRVL